MRPPTFNMTLDGNTTMCCATDKVNAFEQGGLPVDIPLVCPGDYVRPMSTSADIGNWS